MDPKVQQIHDRLAAFSRTPEGYEARMRDFVARIITDARVKLGWSQADLARRTGMSEPFISRVIHQYSNCELKTLSHILCVLGEEPAIYDTTRYTLTPIVQKHQAQRGKHGTTIEETPTGGVRYDSEEVIFDSGGRVSQSVTH